MRISIENGKVLDPSNKIDQKQNIFIDNSLKRFDDIFAAAGHPHCIFKINFKNLLEITQGEIKDIVE